MLMLLLRDKEACPFPLHSQDTVSCTTPVRHGLLLYISNEGVRSEVVEPTWMEIRNLILCRNKLAINLSVANRLVSKPYPSMLRHSDCERCFSAAECMLSHAALESGSKATSGVPSLYSYITRHLQPHHFKYFQTWNLLIDLEAAATSSNSPPLWTSSGWTLERAAEKCISGLYISSCVVGESNSLITLKRRRALDDAVTSMLTKGDRVNISIETTNGDVGDIEDICQPTEKWTIDNIEPSLCTGTIISASPMEFQVQVRKVPRRMNSMIGQPSARSSFRIDKDDATVGVGTMRSNILKLFIDPFDPNAYKELKLAAEKSTIPDKHSVDVQNIWAALPPPGNIKIRRLIVDLDTPTFSCKEQPMATLAVYSGCHQQELSASFAALNPQQRHAVKRISSARDYVLLLGMPGTGKSSTLSYAIRSLVAKGYRVLVASYTHSAVDTVVTKLKESGMVNQL